MEIIRRIQVPTGDILVVKEGDNKPLELVSLGDYGKEVNLKADHMGLNKAPDQVRHTKLLPLEEKWVITISTQYGCSMGCKFCDVPKVGPGKNVEAIDILHQIELGMSIHPEVEHSDRLNIHFARMGEPTWNPNILYFFGDKLHELIERKGKGFKIHPVISTMMPKNNSQLNWFIDGWMNIKNNVLKGEAGLQLSINSTSEVERRYMFNNNCLPLHKIAHIMDSVKPKGRKITLNFAVADYEIDPEKLIQYFDPDYYIIKLTPMHKTHTALDNDIKTKGDPTTYYPYEEYEHNLKQAGYEVLVFIASEEEDKGLITCGNAILSGSLPECTYTEIK